MSAVRSGRKIALSLFFMTLGALCGAGLALLFAPSSGDRTRHLLRMKQEKTRRRAGIMADNFKSGIERLIARMKGISAQLIEARAHLKRAADAETLKAVETGIPVVNQEGARLGNDQHA